LNVIQTGIPDLLIIEPRVFADERGFFLEIFHAARFREAGLPDSFVQDNHSRSKRGVIRGLHYQEPEGQGKLVRCTRGALFDVAVDIRAGSPAFGRWYGMELSEETMRMLWIPAGFAHGFCALTDEADLVYKCTVPYSPRHEHSIVWNDPEIGIKWPVSDPVLSPKDAAAPPLKNASPLPRFVRS
jgi:dTDP-4-dehydrorhamnose 3,5-epimerase